MSGKTVLILIATTLLAGCAWMPPVTATQTPGFLLGLLHGFLAFFTMILSFFTEVKMYATPNSGSLYDLGFVLGFMIFAGGGAKGASGRR